MHPIKEEKIRQRKNIRILLHDVTPSERAEASRRISAAILRLPEWLGARRPLLYFALPDEPDLLALMQDRWNSGHPVILPRVRQDQIQLFWVSALGDLAPGYSGILEPVERCPPATMAEVDFGLVPGRSFTLEGDRLGRGRGHYDRLLTGKTPTATLIGVCFRIQIVSALPVDSRDLRVDRVIAF